MDEKRHYHSIRSLARRFGRSERTIRDWTGAGCATRSGHLVLPAIKAGKKLMVEDEALAIFELRLRRASAPRPGLDVD
jgi:transposase